MVAMEEALGYQLAENPAGSLTIAPRTSYIMLLTLNEALVKHLVSYNRMSPANV